MAWRDGLKEIYEVSLSWYQTHQGRRVFMADVRVFDDALEAAQFRRAAVIDFSTWMPKGGFDGEVSEVKPVKIRKDGKENAA